MRRYPASFAVNDAVSAWTYTRAMMNTRILTICATVAACAAGTSFALAQGYPASPGSYTTAPAPHPPADYRRGLDAMPDFDELDDEEQPRAQNSTALPTPGPAMSPDDPRYGRPMGAPVYSGRGAPQGPVMSPDDPRYGRPAGPPPVIYSDRPDGPPPAYSDRGGPRSGFIDPEDNRDTRPPGAAG